jgi:hypothetical protein
MAMSAQPSPECVALIRECKANDYDVMADGIIVGLIIMYADPRLLRDVALGEPAGGSNRAREPLLAVTRWVTPTAFGLEAAPNKLLISLARSEGFEPPTPRFEVWCSIQLSYERPRVS